MNKKIKIAFLIPVLKGGGAERNVVNLINNLDENLYEIILISGNVGSGLESDAKENIRIINMKCSGLLGMFFKIPRCLKKEKPDILVSALPHVNTIAAMVKYFFFTSIRLVLTEHTTPSLLPRTARTLSKRLGSRFVLPLFMRYFYPVADAVICVSEGVKNDLISIIGKLAYVKVIYNPVFSDSIGNLSKEKIIDERGIFSAGRPVAIAVGRLIKAKDYPTLLRAFKLVSDFFPASLVILGEGPEEKRLKDFADSLGIAKNVFFLGFKANPYKYMTNSSVFVLSSIREGFGNVIVEAMACGTPVVATDCMSGPNEIIENNISGLLVPAENENVLAEAILSIFKNPDLAASLSVAGKKRAEYFSIQKSVQEYEKTFNEIINK